MNFPKFHGIELANGGYVKNFRVEQFLVDPVTTLPGRIWYNDTEDVWKYSEIDSDSGLLTTKYLDKQQDPNAAVLPSGWKTVSSPLVAAHIGSNEAPLWTILPNGIGYYHFPDSKDKYTILSFVVGNDLKIGTKIYPVIHWAPASASIGNVLWNISYIVTKGYGQGGTVNKTVTEIPMLASSSGIAGDHLTIESSTLNAFAITDPGSVITIRISRKGSDVLDTFIGEAMVLAVALTYESDHETTIGRKPNFDIPTI